MAVLVAMPLYALALLPEKQEGQKEVKEEATPMTSLKGTIGNMENYQPLSDVRITLTAREGNLNKTVTTDSLGHFDAGEVPPGIYKVRFEKRGFEPGTYQSLVVSAGRTNTFGFLMFED